MAFKVPNAARLMDLSERFVWALVKSGELESVKIGRARLVTRTAIQQYLERLGGAA